MSVQRVQATDGRVYHLTGKDLPDTIAPYSGEPYSGAHIAEVVEFASGLNPWIEWARIEVAALFHMEYALQKPKQRYAGSVICLARQEQQEQSQREKDVEGALHGSNVMGNRRTVEH